MTAEAPWRSAAKTDAGKVRSRNEDALLENSAQGLWAVADGMGGHRAGDVASQLIVSSLADLVFDGSFVRHLRDIRQCLHWLNRRLGQELTVTADRKSSIMGSTVVTLLIEGIHGACVWAGDSRCYMLREQRLYQLTRDHSLYEELIFEQQMSAEQAQQHPSSHALTRAIGASVQLNLEVLEFEVCPGDVFLLCSDGLYQYLDANALSRALNMDSPEAAIDRLFANVLQSAARDNISAVVVRQ